LKIVITGPECSGKSTIANEICRIFNFGLVPEMAREYLNIRNNCYDESSLNEIAYLQLREEKIAKENHDHICCDTDLLTIIIWQSEKYGHVDHVFMEKWLRSSADIYFLCFPDMDWEYDPQRENPHDREKLFSIYLQYLEVNKANYYILKGTVSQRMEILGQVLMSVAF